MLDLDHARAHVGGEHRAVRPGQHARQIENRQPGERRVAHRGHARCRRRRRATVTRSRQQRVRRLLEAAVALRDDDPPERPGVDLERVALAVENRQRIVERRARRARRDADDAARRAPARSRPASAAGRAASAARARAPVSAVDALARRSRAASCRRRASTLASAAVFAAASQPSTSSDGSASATPAACMRAERGVERLAAFHRRQQVVRRAVDDAAKTADRDAGIVSRTRLKIGMPSITAPSKRNETPACARLRPRARDTRTRPGPCWR